MHALLSKINERGNRLRGGEFPRRRTREAFLGVGAPDNTEQGAVDQN